jgi:hypothetical protein
LPSVGWGTTTSTWLILTSKFSLVDFNRDVAACLIFIPCTTSPAISNLVFKASRSRVFVPFFNKGMAALKSPPKILPSPCPLTIEINRRKLTPKGYGHGRTPRTTISKRTCQAKKD